MKKTTILGFLIVASILNPARATALGDLAAQMQPGSWSQLPSNSTFPDINNIAKYAESAVWDPVSRTLMFCGSYHASSLRCVAYQDSANAWRSLPVPYSYTTYHTYDGNTLDPVTGTYYLREQSRVNLYKFTTASNLWTSMPSLPLSNPTCCASLVYFPDYGGGGLVYFNHGPDLLYFLPDGNGAWRTIPNSLVGGGHSTWNFGEYNPVHKVVVLGNNDGQRLAKLSAAGQLTQLRNFPVTMYDGSGDAGHFTVDPVSGKYLALSAGTTGKEFWIYDVLTDTWTRGPNPPAGLTGAVVSTPIGIYGVTAFLGCGTYASDCMGGLFLYKHAAGSGIGGRPAREGMGILEVLPNPLRGGGLVIRTGSSRGTVKILNMQGKEMVSLKPGPLLRWNGLTARGKRAAPGVYVLNADLDGGRFHQTIVVME